MGWDDAEEFEAQVREWCETVKQPKLDRLYVQFVYRPMLELLAFLTENEFRVFVCSGGGRDFMRVFAEETWGIYKENVIGSAAGYKYGDGKIVRTHEVLGGLALGAGKPEHIFGPDWTAAAVRGRERRCRYRDARSREVRGARQPR